jgi:probable F420-dependent oxidoreductase
MKASYYMTLEQIVGARPDTAGDTLKAIAQAAEAARFDACNLTDHPIPDTTWLNKGGHNAFDPFAALCFVAGFTSRILLHTNIVVLPYRNPFVTAKAATTLDVLSGGRMIMGVGVGYQESEYAALGVDFASRGKLTDEAIDVIKLAWQGEPLSYHGLTFHARDNIQLPAPLQTPNPPIWCGGNGMIAIRRAAQRCDGWQPFFMPPGAVGARHPDAIVTVADLGERVAQLNELRAAAGRTGPFAIAPTSPVGVTALTQEVADKFLEKAREMAAIGVNWVGAGLPGEDAAQMCESIAWFGETVLPELHGLG